LKTRLLLTAALLATVSGCRCGPTVTKNVPQYVVTPKALNFEACPTKDEQGKTVSDVFPDEQKFSLNNQGKAGGGLKLTITGDGKDVFAAKTPVATSVDALATIDLPILFTPTKKGVVKAQMTISDEFEGTDDVAVDLVGTGSDLAAQPTLVASVTDVTGKYCNCGEVGCALSVCEQDFPDTLFKESTTLEVKLTNSGCPALKVTGLEIIPYAGASGTNLAYFIETPAVLPTTDTPLVLTQSENRQTTKIKLRFAPEDDGSNVATRFATLRVKTNDPNISDGDGNPGGFDILLSASALSPAIYTTPTRCDFNDPNDLCGLPARMADKSHFDVKNGGNVAIKIDSTTWKSNMSTTSNQDNRFSITSSIADMTIAPGASVPLEITHNQMPLYVLDLLTISASVSGGAPGSAGRAVISFAGGKKPCLSTTPAIDMVTGQARLDFAAPATTLSAKQLTIKNGPAATCGDLIINSVSVDSNPFFSLIDPMIPAGTKITPGMSFDATVQYKKPVSGGTQVGVLRIDSNDGDYSSPPGYLVQLYSNSPLDELPVAVLKGCLPADTACAAGKISSMSVNLSTLPDGPTAGTKLLLMYGLDSYDPPGTTKKVTKYQFRLVTQPGNANAMVVSLENQGVIDTKSSVKLTLDGAATGLYRVTLDVFDDKDQKSGSSAELKINVLQ
jgi:hypothetical protein